MADYETILTERKGDVLVITLNRPERLNAASLQMAEDLTDALYNLDGARAVLITGAGRAFCSGADLQGRGDRPVTGSGDAAHRSLMLHYNPALTQIMRLDVPVVTAVNGAVWAARSGCQAISCSPANRPISCRRSSISGWCRTAARPGCWPRRSAARVRRG